MSSSESRPESPANVLNYKPGKGLLSLNMACKLPVLLINTVVNPSRNKTSKDQRSSSTFNCDLLSVSLFRHTQTEETRVFLLFAIFTSCPYKTQISELYIIRRLVQATPTTLSLLLLKFSLGPLFQMINKQEGSTNSLNNPFWDSEGLSRSRGELG